MFNVKIMTENKKMQILSPTHVPKLYGFLSGYNSVSGKLVLYPQHFNAQSYCSHYLPHRK